MRVLWKRYVDAGGSLDLTHLAKQDIEHDAIDRVVGTVEQAGFDHGGDLPEPIYATFALLEAIGVPGQVVVQHRSELILQVDAFAEAIGGDQDSQFRPAHHLDALLAQLIG